MGKKEPKSTVSANIKKKRLYITLQGLLPKKEAERLYTDIRFCVSDLEPGFTVITDLSRCRIGHLSSISTFRKVTSFLQEKQVGKVVRVIGQAKVFYLQLLKLRDKTKDYEPLYVATFEEAEALLDELGKKGSAI